MKQKKRVKEGLVAADPVNQSPNTTCEKEANLPGSSENSRESN